MRLIIALIIALILNIVMTLNHKELSCLLHHLTNLAGSSSSIIDEEHWENGLDSETENPEVMRAAINKVTSTANFVFWMVVLGWAVVKLFIQFKKFILAFILIQVVILFFLSYLGVIELTLHLTKVMGFLNIIKAKVLELGYGNVAAFLLGNWAGLGGSRKEDNQE